MDAAHPCAGLGDAFAEKYLILDVRPFRPAKTSDGNSDDIQRSDPGWVQPSDEQIPALVLWEMDALPEFLRRCFLSPLH
ncbi:hypothetical protein MJO28_000656 [Puccinia striiformis f. sp. tritici]|uniref:Uncharacterized protein n=1 Tax=Puccinia striiformis f. sp. tritici TaxID=168172 RepID=A0ACC0EYV1_9BASI|nr:hypothetical protein MJO28_000656 [Puccinia striiformis f. sp. tritici]